MTGKLTVPNLAAQCLKLLVSWHGHVKRNWTWLSVQEWASYSPSSRPNPPGGLFSQTTGPVAGYYGTGYGGWGVLAHASTIGAYRVLAQGTGDREYQRYVDKGVRYLLSTHTSGPLTLADNEKWGGGLSPYHGLHAAEWLERAVMGLGSNESELSPYDQAALRAVITLEADSCLYGSISRASGSAWQGSLLARAAASFPQHAHAELWRQQAFRFLQEGLSWQRISIQNLERLLAALCAVSLASLPSGDLAAKAQGLAALWEKAFEFILRFCLQDGITLGFCGRQALLLPVLAWAVQRGNLTEHEGLSFIAEVTASLAREQLANGDGSFYGVRLGGLLNLSEYECYWWESETAFALAATYRVLSAAGIERKGVLVPQWHPQKGEHAPEVSGCYYRDSSRFASWLWKGHSALVQGVLIPISGRTVLDSHGNMVGTTRLKEHKDERLVQYHREYAFPGGFATLGLLAEAKPAWPMAKPTPSLRHGIAFWVLPDGYSAVLLSLVWTERKVTVSESRGTILRLASDRCPVQIFEEFATVNNEMIVKALWGGKLALQHHGGLSGNRGGQTPHWVELSLPLEQAETQVLAGSIIRDTCVALVTGLAPTDRNFCSNRLQGKQIQASGTNELKTRAVELWGTKGERYVMAANFDRYEAAFRVRAGDELEPLVGPGLSAPGTLTVPPASMALFVGRET